jgi:hypothetical protein
MPYLTLKRRCKWILGLIVMVEFDQNNKVFLSYRRSESSFTARSIFQYLFAKGHDVFMDVESINNGTFDVILEQIRARIHFLIILSPHTLDRFLEPGDWLRREIEYAMEKQRNIVPVLVEDFKFDKKAKKYLTGKLEELPGINGLTLTHEYFEAGMEKLRNRFLGDPTSVLMTTTGESIIRGIPLNAPHNID